MTKYQALAKKLASENEGRLPSVTVLRKLGYEGLYQYIRRYPKEFKYKQDVQGTRSYSVAAKNRYVALAEILVEQNDGKLPTVSWLMANGCSGLLSYMSNHPDFFKNIIRSTKRTSKEEHVRKAEEMAKANGGILPGGGFISSDWALYKCMRRNHKLFKHIKGALPPEPKRVKAGCR